MDRVSFFPLLKIVMNVRAMVRNWGCKRPSKQQHKPLSLCALAVFGDELNIAPDLHLWLNCRYHPYHTIVVTGKSLDSPEDVNVDKMSEKCRKNVRGGAENTIFDNFCLFGRCSCPMYARYNTIASRDSIAGGGIASILPCFYEASRKYRCDAPLAEGYRTLSVRMLRRGFCTQSLQDMGYTIRGIAESVSR